MCPKVERASFSRSTAKSSEYERGRNELRLPDSHRTPLPRERMPCLLLLIFIFRICPHLMVTKEPSYNTHTHTRIHFEPKFS